MHQVIVGIADMKLGKGDTNLITYALGSCVGICLYDEVLRTGALLHAMLPSSYYAENEHNLEKYVNTGIPFMYRVICGQGVDRTRLKAKIIGGAKMFDFNMTGSTMDIGTANVLEARKCLKALGIPVVQEVTGGVVGRTVRFNTHSGHVHIQATDNHTMTI